MDVRELLSTLHPHRSRCACTCEDVINGLSPTALLLVSQWPQPALLGVLRPRSVSAL